MCVCVCTCKILCWAQLNFELFDQQCNIYASFISRTESWKRMSEDNKNKASEHELGERLCLNHGSRNWIMFDFFREHCDLQLTGEYYGNIFNIYLVSEIL